jgi:hypothetical protein
MTLRVFPSVIYGVKVWTIEAAVYLTPKKALRCLEAIELVSILERLLKKVSLVVGTIKFWKFGFGDLPILIAALSLLNWKSSDLIVGLLIVSAG